MPTLIVHELKKQLRKVPVKGDACTIGRGNQCDLVLGAPSVSRDHAVVQKDPQSGKWFIACKSQTNQVVVDGKIIVSGASAWLKEASEILVGTESLLLYSDSDQKAESYFTTNRARYEKKSCPACDWTGMVSALRKDPPCARCGATGLKVFEEPGIPADTGGDGEETANATLAVSLDDMRASLLQLKAAKQSHIERADGWEGSVAQRKNLSETEPLVLARGADLGLRGFVFGTATVQWVGRRWSVTSNLLLGGLRVNGEATKSSPLRNGDLIEIGPNKFKIVTD